MTTIKKKSNIETMNTKKTDWNHKPKFKEISLHSFRWDNKAKTYAFFTLGEEECVKLSFSSKSVKGSFMLFHTPSDYIIFSDSIDIKLFGANVTINKSTQNNIELRKIKETLEFYSGGELILKTADAAFSTSTTLSFIAEGDGEVCLEVF